MINRLGWPAYLKIVGTFVQLAHGEIYSGGHKYVSEMTSAPSVVMPYLDYNIDHGSIRCLRTGVHFVWLVTTEQLQCFFLRYN
jgi:hypothetical protein